MQYYMVIADGVMIIISWLKPIYSFVVDFSKAFHRSEMKKITWFLALECENFKYSNLIVMNVRISNGFFCVIPSFSFGMVYMIQLIPNETI